MTTKPRRVFRLSEHEARVLETIFLNIGGNPDNSSRKTVDVLSRRLLKTFGGFPRVSHSGSLYFHDFLSETLRGR